MSLNHKNTWVSDLVRRSSPGDRPWGLYWAMPIVVGVATVGLGGVIASHPSRGPRAAAAVSWGVGVAAIFWHVVRQRGWDREQHRRRLEALEAVIALTAATGIDEQAEVRILQLLPHAMQAMLGPKVCIVGLLEEEGKVLRIVAGDGADAGLVGERFAVESLPMAQECLRTRYVSAVVDVNDPLARVDSSLAKRAGLRKMVVVPMTYQEQMIGLMIVGERRARVITELDVRRAWLWGSLTAVMVANCRMYKRMSESIAEQQRVWEHRDALYAVNTAIQRPGTLEEKLQQIVDLSPGPLEIDGALMWLVAEDNPNELVVAAVTQPWGDRVRGYRLVIRGSKTEKVMRQRAVVVVENGPADLELNPFLKSHLPHGSLIFEPLLTRENQPLGLLVLLRKEAGGFRADQIKMARMFSARAAAAIETAQLYQQTRRDADDKTTLLRELNHRVKNNLASIVSLLSLNQPALDAEARQWLDRAVERIGAMAQVHGLFSGIGQSVRSGGNSLRGGGKRVTLEELVEQTVLSVSVAKPAGVVVRLELGEGTALRADRAVSLAMAMHELCYNGLVHSLGGGGTLTIRSRRSNGDLAVEVEDDAGTGRPAEEPIERETGGRSGIGLSLVRGLVGRELRGRFTLAPGPGGAVATVQFPLLAEEGGGNEGEKGEKSKKGEKGDGGVEGAGAV